VPEREADDSIRSVLVILQNITERKRAEASLRESEQQFRTLAENAPDLIMRIGPDLRYQYVNPVVCEFLSLPLKAIVQMGPRDHVLPEDQLRAWEATLLKVFLTGQPVIEEFEFNGPNGPRNAEARVAPERANGVVRSVLVILRDITERKRAEAILRESEQQFRIIANDTPAFLWMTSPDGQNSFINKPLADFLGIPEHNTLPDGAYVVHPEEDNGVGTKEKFLDCLARRAEFADEHRLRRFDGEYCWVLSRAIPRWSPTGEFLGYSGVILDISDRKRAEEELRTAYNWLMRELNERIRAEREIRDLGQRLITAQEEERARIARELHDDVSQQIGALSLALNNLKVQITAEGPEVIEQAERLHQRILQLASSIRQLSHELHPALLEYAGIAVALRSYCGEFSSLSGLNISFQSSGAYDDVPPAAALCLYRVTQEALRNVAKHAATNQAEVYMARTNGNLHLTVSDRGVGFDKERARTQGGLGFLSMKERVGLVKGALEVESEPGFGTTVRIEIPVVSLSTRSLESGSVSLG